MLQALTGAGLLTSENPLWRRQRRLMQPAFHQRHLVTFGDLMTQTMTVMLDRWWKYACEGTAFDIVHEMMQVTSDGKHDDRADGLTMLSPLSCSRPPG